MILGFRETMKYLGWSGGYLKGMRKKFLAVILAAAMTLSFGACGKKEGEDQKTDIGKGSAVSTVKADPKDVTFMISDEDIQYGGIEGDIEQAVRFSDKIVLNTYEWVEDETEQTLASNQDADDLEYSGTTIFRVYIAPLEGGNAEEIYKITVEADAKESKYIDRILTNGDKLDVIVTTYKNNDYEKPEVELLEFDANGKQAASRDISYLYNTTGDSYLSSISIMKTGDIVAFYDQDIKIYDATGKEKVSAKSDGWIMGSCITKDGSILVITDNKGGGMVAKVMDPEAGGFKEEYDMGAGYLASPEWIYTGEGDYDFFYRSESAFYGYNLADKKQTTICDFTVSDIDTTYMNSCVMLDESTILSLGYNWDKQVPVVEKYVKVDPSQVQNKKELTLMCTWTSSELRQEVINFNKAHSDIRINLVDYGDQENPEEKISADIAAGNIPDIFYISGGIGGMSVDQAISKGMFEDLTPYIDSDPDIAMDDFVPSVMNAMKKDGKLYYFGSSFNINALLAKGSDVGDKDGWTFEEMKAYVDSKPDARIFESTKKQDILDTFLYSCGSDFIDWDKGECYFDSPGFKSLLELCNRGDDQETDWENMKMTEDLRQGKQLFMIGYISPDELQMYKALYKDDLAVIGYPNEKREGIYVEVEGGMAMSTKCSDKDAAWSFIRTFMTKEYQGQNYNNGRGCPTRLDVLESYFKAKQATQEYTDEYGNKVYPMSGEWGWDDLIVEMKPLSDEQVTEFRTIIDQVSDTWDYDSSLNEIITEEAKAYFAGDKTVDETCKIIQNRASTYIKESK